MNKSESIKELASALVKAQQSFLHVKRDKTVKVKTRTGGEYQFSYAPLESIMDAIKKPLFDNGLSLLQDVNEGRVTTLLFHSSGEFYQSSGTEVKVTEQGAQAYGSALTYARRYDLTLTLGICADDDDDGGAASGNETTVKGMPKAPITPTTGAWDGVEPQRVEIIRRLSGEVVELLESGALDDAYDLLYVKHKDAGKISNDEFVAIWSDLQPLSKQRASLKKMRDQRIKVVQLGEQA